MRDNDVGATGCLAGTTTQLLGMSNKKEGPAPRIPGFTRLSSTIYNLKYALIDNSSPASIMTKSQALQTNLDVDYVISYRFAKTGR
jgi:anoctamin-10